MCKGWDMVADGGRILSILPSAAPELSDNHPFTQQCDVWAAGCIVYELTALQKAFPGDNVMGVISNTTKGV